jgi:hypothetical protein
MSLEKEVQTLIDYELRGDPILQDAMLGKGDRSVSTQDEVDMLMSFCVGLRKGVLRVARELDEKP